MLPNASHSPASTPSPWIERWLPSAPANGEALDLACGHGRHSALLLARGWRVCALDRDETALRTVQARADALHATDRLTTVLADVENAAWPLPGRRFDAIVVTNYLWRPLLPTLFASLNVKGLLLYETFAIGNEAFGRPTNPNFLLQPGELLTAANVSGLNVVAYEHGRLSAPDRVVQRLVAIKGDTSWPLEPTA